MSGVNYLMCLMSTSCCPLDIAKFHSSKMKIIIEMIAMSRDVMRMEIKRVTIKQVFMM